MELFEVVEHFWVDFQHGQLPDFGGWNYGLMALFIVLQGRFSAVMSGVAAAAGYLNLGPIIIIAFVVRIIVDIVWYRLGSTGHIDRVGKRIGLYRFLVQPINEDLSARPMRFLFLAKVTNGLSIPALIMAGNSGIPVRKWLLGTFLADIVWMVPLLLFGYFATDALSVVDGGMSYLTFGFSAVFLTGFVIKAVLKRRAVSV